MKLKILNEDDFFKSIGNGRCFVFMYVQGVLSREDVLQGIKNMQDEGLVPEEYSLDTTADVTGLIDSHGRFTPDFELVHHMTRVKLIRPVPEPGQRKAQMMLERAKEIVHGRLRR